MHKSMYRYWRIYSSLTGAASIAALATYLFLVSITGRSDEPVVVSSDFQVHTPRVPVNGDLNFSLWRQSTESCPGTAVMALTSLDKPGIVVSVRYPYATPGFNSPPRLVITRQLPAQITPGRWRVQTGVDSRCPTRQKYDETGDFEVEVY